MMTTRNLKWIAIIVPSLFLGAVIFLRDIFGGLEQQLFLELGLFAIVILGVSGFANWVFGIVDRREQEIQVRTRQLQALREAALALTTELELDAVLQKVVDLACELTAARYGALGVVDARGTAIQKFITYGIDRNMHEEIGMPPKGHGVLGLLIREGKSIRLGEIASHVESVGYPPAHPLMKTFLGVPIRWKGRSIGNLYLADKRGDPNAGDQPAEFNAHDQDLLEMFATQAAIAIENAKLYRQTQLLAILEERERFRMDLHDGIIQSIYGIGLTLENVQHGMEAEPKVATGQIDTAIKGLNEVIRDIRNYILDLKPERFQGRDLNSGFQELARDLRANSLIEVEVETDKLKARQISPEKALEILYIVREAFANIRKHSQATEVNVQMFHQDGEWCLVIADDGVGIDPQMIDNSPGQGLGNMRERARSLGGMFEIRPRNRRPGTEIQVRFPT